MSIATWILLADLANTPILHDPIEMGAWTAMIGLFATLGKLALSKIDKMITIVVRTQEKQVEDQRKAADSLVERHAEQLDRIAKEHRDQTERITKAHSEQIEQMSAAHAAQVEALTGITVDNRNAMTALTVQIDRYTHEMREFRTAIEKVAAVIDKCPGWGNPANPAHKDRRNTNDHRDDNARHRHPSSFNAEDPHD